MATVTIEAEVEAVEVAVAVFVAPFAFGASVIQLWFSLKIWAIRGLFFFNFVFSSQLTEYS